jgi:hypothetical protein
MEYELGDEVATRLVFRLHFFLQNFTFSLLGQLWRWRVDAKEKKMKFWSFLASKRLK